MKYIVTLLLICLYTTVYGQSSPNDYVFSSHTNATLYNMSGADTLIGGGQDNITDDARPLPFPFAFLGSLHASFSVAANGIVYLSPLGGSNNYFQIAALRADGNVNTYKWSGTGMGTSRNGAIVCKTFGTEPNRQFVISFEKMSLSKRMGNEDATFQVALHESSGVVQFIYGEINVSDTLSGFYDPCISKTNVGQHKVVNTNAHTAYYTTSYPWGYTVNPGVINSLHSPVNGSCRTYIFTPPSVPNYTTTTFTADTVISGIAQITPPDHQAGYIYYLRASKSPSGPFSAGTLFTGITGGMPDSTFYYRIYRSNGGSVSTNYVSGSVTYGSPRKLTSQSSGYWMDHTTWGTNTGIYPVWGDTVEIAHGDTVRLFPGFSPSATVLCVSGVLDYASALNNPVEVQDLYVDTSGLVKVHNGSVAFSPNSITGGTLIVSGNLTGPGKVDMRYNNCRLSIVNKYQLTTHVLDVNFEQGNNNVPLLYSLTLATANNVQLMKPLTVKKEIVGEYGSITTNNNLTLDKNATVGMQSPSSDFRILRYSRAPLFAGNVNFAPGTSPYLYYFGNYRYKDPASSFAIPPFVAGNEVPVNDSVERLYVYSNSGVDFNNAITITNTMEWQNGIVNMLHGDDFIVAGTNVNYDNGGIRTNGWIKYFQYQYPYTGLMNTPGNSPVYPIIANGAKRFAFLQGALAADGLYGVKHTDLVGTTTLVTPFVEDGNTFSKRSNAYWEISSPTGSEFLTNAFHFRAGDMDSITDHQLTTVCYINGVAAGSYLSSIGRKSAAIVSRTGLNASNIGNHHFYVGIADANPLSTDLLSFKGTAKKEGNFLEWEIAPSHEFSTIELQKCKDGKSYENIAKFLTSNDQLKYSFLDGQPFNGHNFYRLKLTERAEKGRYSNTVLINLQNKGENIYSYPNPAKQTINVAIGNADIQHYRIIDLTGKEQMSGDLNISNGIGNVSLVSLPAGIYFLNLYSHQEMVYSTQILKQ